MHKLTDGELIHFQVPDFDPEGIGGGILEDVEYIQALPPSGMDGSCPLEEEVDGM